MTIAEIVAAHRSGELNPEATIAACLARIAAHDDAAVFTALSSEEMLASALRALSGAEARRLPLYGVPFAVKDNIDVAGLPTTCACPDFAYVATRDAASVARLKRAGAVVIGKTNLDQFATGLVGRRSPYGTPRNPVRPDLIPGGSSSGSAVAVSAGLVPFALGTDTAGSGRVPAGLNNIVGLKPSCGLVSTAGLVPACRSLDCISVFALDVADAWSVLRAMAGVDPSDPYSRPLPVGQPGECPPALRLGIPRAGDRPSFGDRLSEPAFQRSVARARALGSEIVEIDMAPFFEAARLLYEGPWIAERYAAVGPFLEARPDAIHPVVRSIIERGASFSAVEAFRGQYRLAELRAQATETLAGLDALMVPTLPTVYTPEQIDADPVRLNSNLGVYTNFVNLLDMCGLAVPSEMRPDGAPWGVTFLAPAGRDAHLAAIGAAFHAATGLPLGATGRAQRPRGAPERHVGAGQVEVAVFGAHLAGLPLNGELVEGGGAFLRAARTSADYRMFLLPGGRVARPGVLRVEPGRGAPLACEIWSLPLEAFGRLVARILPPLGIGTVVLEDGSSVKGFLMEVAALQGIRDITVLGGWRAYLAAEAAPVAVGVA
ncbi:allophanate hydrolase [Bosea sp. 117]|uniref:allophanate hydrolase n=1 Tax=Bosea sp. 117 TaxID=1125973 RepID=UPI0020BF14FD|nr:allophanate hydrolase [Bosea sp. 117]